MIAALAQKSLAAILFVAGCYIFWWWGLYEGGADVLSQLFGSGYDGIVLLMSSITRVLVLS